MRDFIEIQISPIGFQADHLSGMLYSQGCLGIHEASEDDWRIYFTKDWFGKNAIDLFRRLRTLNPAFDENSVILTDVPDQDWGREWRHYFKPLQPVEGIWIRPPWQKLSPGAGGVEIVIDPQMAFGTGHHETTALVLKMMKEISLTQMRVLDVGTGSGILAIAAAKLGAEKIVAVDNDSNAIDNARHNIKLNQVKNIELKYGDIHSFELAPFNVVLANVNLEALCSLASKWKDVLIDKGKVIVSGVLREEARQLESLYNKEGLILLQREDMNEWTAMSFKIAQTL